MISSQKACWRLARLAARYPCRRRFATATGSDHIRIVEVGPRDGLQNEKKAIPLETKIALIQRLAQTGLRTIEAGSFVSPKWVPQMANSSEILQSVLENTPKAPLPIRYQFLLPNSKGLQNFLSVHGAHMSSSGVSAGIHNAPPTPPPSPKPTDDGPALNTSSQDPNTMPSSTNPVDAMSSSSSPSSSTQTDNGPALNTSSGDPNAMPSSTNPVDAMSSSSAYPPHSASAPEVELSIFTAATETFTRKNTNCSIAESLERFKPIFAAGKDHNLKVRAYISVALGCPYEGPDVDPHKVAELAVSLLEMGADEISVADTTGQGTAPKTKELLKTLAAAGVTNDDLALHFHDTYGQALVNTMVGLEHGVRTFDSAVGGLGGCPYSPGATGNVATEDLVHFLHSLGAQTGVDIEKLSEVGDWITKEIGKSNESRAGKATLAGLRAK